MGLPFEMDPTPPPENRLQANIEVCLRAADLVAALTTKHLVECPTPSPALAEAVTDFYAAKRNLSR